MTYDFDVVCPQPTLAGSTEDWRDALVCLVLSLHLSDKERALAMAAARLIAREDAEQIIGRYRCSGNVLDTLATVRRILNDAGTANEVFGTTNEVFGTADARTSPSHRRD